MKNKIVMIIVGILIVTGCKKAGKMENLFTNLMNKPEGYILSKNGYNFHYLTFIEKGTQSGNYYLGKDVSLLMLSTIKRWANQGFGNFTPPPRRNAFINKIEAVIKQIENGAYNGAENKIANDIIPFMESSVTGPFRNTFGLLLESSLIGVIQAEDTIEVDISYESLFNANPYSLQEIEAIICKPIDFVCEVIVPMPTLEDTLQAVSCALAMGLEDRENREILYQYLTNSPYNEHKIYLKDYINEIRSDGNTVVTTMSISSGYTLDYLEGLTQNHPEIAIHFPDSSHHVEWTNNYTHLVPWVTYVPPFISDTEVTQLTGFIYNGENTFINGETPPNHPVLIITPEPPESIIKFPPETLEYIPENSLRLPEENLLSGSFKSLMYKMYIHHKCEPWWLGDMEIYTKAYVDAPPYTNYRTNFTHVNKRNKWYKTYRVSVYPITCGFHFWILYFDFGGKPIYPYYTGLDDIVVVKVYEDDWWWNPDDYLGHVSIGKRYYGTSCDPGDNAIPTITEYRGYFKVKAYYYYNWQP